MTSDDPTRVCTVCSEARPISLFGVYKIRGSSRRRLTCNVCRREAARSRYASNPEVQLRMRENARDWRIQKTYGITQAEVSAMAERQKMLCAICQLRKPLCVDHCHSTGKVRALLCRACNFGIGSFHDDTSKLDSAVAYLRSQSPPPSFGFCLWLRGLLEQVPPGSPMTAAQYECIQHRLAVAIKRESA